MALNDSAVLTAAVGYVFLAPIGQAAPTPAEVVSLNPETFGNQSATVTTGASTAGNFTLTVGGQTTANIAWNATAVAIKTAVELLSTVGAGKATVTGTAATGAGVVITIATPFAGSVTGTAVALTGGSLVVVSSGWRNVGHTSRGDLPEFGYDGGDSEVKGTWQNESLREVVTDPIADYLTLNLHQFDQDTFELYYGANSSGTAGVFSVANGTPAAVEKSLLVVIIDGTSKIAFHTAKASIRRDDALSLATDEFSAVPVKARFLKHSTLPKFSWISSALFV
jgi:hypothetical protein